VPAQDVAAHLLKSALPNGVGSFVDGHIVAGTGQSIDLIAPSTGRCFASYADAGADVTGELIASSVVGAKVWAAKNPFERAEILRSVSQAVAQHAAELARLESATVGKPLRDTRVEAAKVAEMFAYYAGWADKLSGLTIPVPGDWLVYTQHVPWGVVTAVTPFNAPLFTAGWNSAAPLAAGNAVIIKPSESTPAGTLKLAAIAVEAGLPSGVFNVAVGAGPTTGAAVTTDRRIGKVTFIGSVGTGRRVAAAAAQAGIPAVTELGGKSANIVFADSELDRAADGAISAIFSGAGQSCVAGSRLLVQRSAYDELVDKVVRRASTLVQGDPLDAATEVGPIITVDQLATVRSLIDAGVADGARQLTGATKPAHLAEGALAGGHWVPPTVLDGVKQHHRLETTEVFGPVLGVDVFEDEEDAVKRANATNFGLAGAVWTHDVSRAHRVAAAVNAGTFWINAYKTINVAVPFGGFGDSGYGRSSGPGVLEEYSQTKAVWVPVQPVGAPFPSMGY
jgi:acyl-CoA reductase-like NAD-dependent aldehyde dehydrogenase